MNGYQRRTEEKTKLILRTAMDLFQQYGIEKVSVRDIAKRAGVSHVTIYKHFGNINNIVRHIIETQGVFLLNQIKEKISSDISLEDKLDFLIFQRTGVTTRLSSNQLLRGLAANPELSDFISNVWDREIGKLYLELLEQGVRDGYITEDISKETMRIFIEIIREGLISEKFQSSKLYFDEKTIRELHYIVIRGLSKNRFPPNGQ